MAQKDLFTRLQRLFSTDIVIRNVGGNTIKTIDINSLSKGVYIIGVNTDKGYSKKKLVKD